MVATSSSLQPCLKAAVADLDGVVLDYCYSVVSPMQAATALPTSPNAEQWQLEFAQALPQLEQLAA